MEKLERWVHASEDGEVARRDELHALMNDDGGGGGVDSELWGPRSDFPFPFQDLKFWRLVCNGTNDTWVQALRNASDKRALDGWPVAADKTCREKDMMPGEFTSESAAYEACGPNCSSVVDVGCQRRTFKVCKVGSEDEAATNATCLRWRPPSATPPNAEPGKPKEMAIWKELCAQAGPSYRLLWEQRECSNADAVTLEGGGKSPARCAELTKNNTACGKLFEYQEAAPPTCKCIPKNKPCNARMVSTEKWQSDVYLLMNFSDPNSTWR